MYVDQIFQSTDLIVSLEKRVRVAHVDVVKKTNKIQNPINIVAAI